MNNRIRSKWNTVSAQRGAEQNQGFWVKYPFAWAGVYYLPAGRYELILQAGPAVSLTVALLPFSGPDKAALEDAVEIYSQEFHVQTPGGLLKPGRRLVRLDLKGHAGFYDIDIAEAGTYALFAEYPLDEFQGRIRRVGEEVPPALMHDYDLLDSR
jgi:hypothetical protein